MEKSKYLKVVVNIPIRWYNPKNPRNLRWNSHKTRTRKGTRNCRSWWWPERAIKTHQNKEKETKQFLIKTVDRYHTQC